MDGVDVGAEDEADGVGREVAGVARREGRRRRTRSRTSSERD